MRVTVGSGLSDIWRSLLYLPLIHVSKDDENNDSLDDKGKSAADRWSSELGLRSSADKLGNGMPLTSVKASQWGGPLRALRLARLARA